mgnify:CR=1 FL=1
MDITELKKTATYAADKVGAALTTAVRLPLIAVAETADFCSKAVMIAGEFAGAALAVDGTAYLAGIRTELPNGVSVSYGTRLFAVSLSGFNYSHQTYGTPAREDLDNMALVELDRKSVV